MDGTGAEGADPTGSIATGTTTRDDAPRRPAGRADATGPLPVHLPTDATGPLPAGALVPDPTTADPAEPAPADPGPTDLGAPTAGMPVVPEPPAPAVPAGEPRTTALPAAGGAFDVFATEPPSTAAAPPDDAAGPTTALPTTGGAAGPPATDLFAADPPNTGSGTQAFDVFAEPAPTAATPAAPGPPAGLPAADLFAADPPGTGAPTGPAPADLFTPGGATTAATPGALPPTAIRPADATGPMPLAIPPTDAPVEPAVAPVTTALPLIPPAAEPAAGAAVQDASASETTLESVPGTGAWSFTPGSGDSEAWSFAGDARPSGETQAQPLPVGRTSHRRASRSATAAKSTRTRSRKRVAWPLTIVGVLVAVAAGIALAVSYARADPNTLITAAVTDVGGWNGVHYQGAVAASGGGQIRFDLTVTVDGATGTLSRDGGQATAEIRRDASGTVLKANRTWWLYHQPTRADDLADTWVAEPLTETKEVEPILALHPYALASHIRPEQQPRPQWTALEQRRVDGQDAVVLSDGNRRVVVATAAPHHVLAVDIGPARSLAPVQVSGVADEETDAIARAAGEIRDTEAPKTLAQRLQERPLVDIQLEPEHLCVTPSCSVTVTVTNSGSLPAQGRLEVSADGKLVATHPLDVQPGQVATFTATAPNPQFSTPGATGQILWESRAIDD